MYCRKCGNELKEDDEFCNKCGTNVNITKNIEIEHEAVGSRNFISIISDKFNVFKTILHVCIIIMIFSFLIIMFGKVNILWNIARTMFFISGIVCAISLIACQIYSSVRKKPLPFWMHILEVIAIIAIIISIINFVVNKDYERRLKVTPEDLERTRQELMYK